MYNNDAIPTVMDEQGRVPGEIREFAVGESLVRSITRGWRVAQSGSIVRQMIKRMLLLLLKMLLLVLIQSLLLVSRSIMITGMMVAAEGSQGRGFVFLVVSADVVTVGWVKSSLP